MHLACVHYAHAQHDITRFAYDASHVTMTSPAFAFQLCQGDDIGITSLCSHGIRITLMRSSCLDCDVIVTCVNHDFSHSA